MNLVEKIGVPATLEKIAEDSSALSRACLSIARKMRAEYETPVPQEIYLQNFNEEVAKVLVHLNYLVESGFISNESIESSMLKLEEKLEKRFADK